MSILTLLFSSHAPPVSVTHLNCITPLLSEALPLLGLLATFVEWLQIVTHCSHSQLEAVTKQLWIRLFEDSQNTEEPVLKITAAYLGKFTTTLPMRFLPELEVSRLETVVAYPVAYWFFRNL